MDTSYLPVPPWRRTPRIQCAVCDARATSYVQQAHLEPLLGRDVPTLEMGGFGIKIPTCADHLETEIERLCDRDGMASSRPFLRFGWWRWIRMKEPIVWRIREWLEDRRDQRSSA